MKRFKFALALLITFALTGCIDISMDVSIKNNDSGTIKYVFACQTEYCDSIDEENDSTVDAEDFKDIPNATAKEITYTKNDVEYKGTEVNIPFTSLDEFNTIMIKINENDVKDSGESTLNPNALTATRTGSKVTIKAEGDEEEYQEAASILPYINYAMNITIEGKLVTHNADKYDEKTNTLTWNASTMLKEGISLEYNTSSFNLLYIGIAGGILVLIIVVVIILMRKNNKPASTTPVTVTEPEIKEQPHPTIPSSSEVFTATPEEPTSTIEDTKILDVNPNNNNY